jgi:hypothetical protein
MKRKITQIRRSRKNCLKGNFEMISRPTRILEPRMSHAMFDWRRVVVIIRRPSNLERASQRWRREFPGK